MVKRIAVNTSLTSGFAVLPIERFVFMRCNLPGVLTVFFFKGLYPCTKLHNMMSQSCVLCSSLRFKAWHVETAQTGAALALAFVENLNAVETMAARMMRDQE